MNLKIKKAISVPNNSKEPNIIMKANFEHKYKSLND